MEENKIGPDIIDCEIYNAIKALKQNNAEGFDLIPAELIQQISPTAMKILRSICKEIYTTGFIYK